jgi:hypothetical protein
MLPNLNTALEKFIELRKEFTIANPPTPPTEAFITKYKTIENLFKYEGSIYQFSEFKGIFTEFLTKYPKICMNVIKFDLTDEHIKMMEKGRKLSELANRFFYLLGPGTYDPYTFIRVGQDRFDTLLSAIREMIKILKEIIETYKEFVPLFRNYRISLDHCFNFKPLQDKCKCLYHYLILLPNKEELYKYYQIGFKKYIKKGYL